MHLTLKFALLPVLNTTLVLTPLVVYSSRFVVLEANL
jgi:hypothetical protein